MADVSLQTWYKHVDPSLFLYELLLLACVMILTDANSHQAADSSTLHHIYITAQL